MASKLTASTAAKRRRPKTRPKNAAAQNLAAISQTIEYSGREHLGTSAAEFKPLTSLNTVLVGDRVVCPRSQNIRGIWPHGRAMALKLAGNSLANLGLF